MSTEEIINIENEIDDAFNKSELLELGYTQAVWTLLSVVEDHHFDIRVCNPLDKKRELIYIDRLINLLSHPLQVCHKNASVVGNKFSRELIYEHYNQANEWIDRAKDYNYFCSIFPLYHNNEIDIQISGDTLITTDRSTHDLSYEAYNCLVVKRHSERDGRDVSVDPNTIAPFVSARTVVKNDSFFLNFTSTLIKQLSENLEHTQNIQFSLPNSWKFKHFSVNEFKITFTTIQSMAYGWFIARQIAYHRGIKTRGYKSALWTPGKSKLISRLALYTGLNKEKITTIVSYLTFGDVGIRNPDIAIQPIVDLKNGEYALSPFVWLSVNCERNLCVLLNQIKEDKKIYSDLVNEKERKLRDEIVSKLDVFDYDFKFGEIDNTDIDLAIIDRTNKKCLIMELKWFIEPAESREVIHRSKEVKKGVIQAQKIHDAWEKKERRLISEMLDIDDSFDFLVVVSSVSSIGDLSAQDGVTPVIKTWHLVDEMLDKKDLGAIMDWLQKRKYLPQKDINYKIYSVDIQSGKWKSTWYVISPT